jgi:hypothetical protein
MGAIIEVKYFNSFVLRKTMTTEGQTKPVWNGSFGVPVSEGGYPHYPSTVAATESTYNWTIEEARIRGGYNNTNVDYGVKAYLVEEEPNASTRINTVIYSGIFNSRTGVNDTNVFSVGQDITKSADPANGSIQRLYAEDTNLIIFQENKISRALVNKDAIYAAEGGGTVTASNLTIGVIQPFPGRYGISKNPESFAAYGYDKYFTDENNNTVLKLSGGSIQEVSGFGMTDFFRDQLNNMNRVQGAGFAQGGWDIHNKQYVVSIYQNPLEFPGLLPNGTDDPETYKTLSFDSGVSGWTTFFSYKPDQILSLRDKLYTLKNGAVWQHYSEEVGSLRGNFYDVNTPSSIRFVLNQNATQSKTFKTISYEGSNGWQVDSIFSDATGEDQNGSIYQTSQDSAALIYSYTEGAYDAFNTVYPGIDVNGNPAALIQPLYYAGFNRKENKYTANLVNNSLPSQGEIIFGESISGIKGYYSTVTMSTDTVTNLGGEKELFSVSYSYTQNSGY